MPVDPLLGAIRDRALLKLDVTIMNSRTNGGEKRCLLSGPDVSALMTDATGKAVIAVP
jgi:hypothetical protein